MIELRQVSKSYGPVGAARDVTLTVADGQAIVLFGPSGCGKTTVLRLIAGLEAPDCGEVLIDGEVASRPGWLKAPRERKVGFVFQTPALWPHMTVAENIRFGLKDRKSEAFEQVLGVLDLVGLKNRFPDELSGGEARRVALARTLAARPRHLLLDEPLSNLDLDSRESLLRVILQAHHESGGALIYVTHDTDESEAISPKRIRMQNGRLLQ
ncbi:ATP-binding cassette domain-containing protein [bacterium CPR1]|nr:ATP-binding cassette domain-containing protein [bacterium CPR1]